MIDEASEIKRLVTKLKCEKDHLFFTRYFFYHRQQIKFKVNWHHQLISDALQRVIEGKCKNLVINVPPGSSKTELAVINFVARGLALNPWCRFLHLSSGDDLVLLNSQTARDLIYSEEFQELWPLVIADDAKAKKRWNVLIDGKKAGGIYAVSLGGQITGFRAGHMKEGFQGAILIDDPLKADDAYSKLELKKANRKLLSTVKSRKANPDTPIVLIMQRLAIDDCTGFIEQGNMGADWEFLIIPALIDEEYVSKLPEHIQKLIEPSEREEKERFSYWPYKEPVKDLINMETGIGSNSEGVKISRAVFNSQMQQKPTIVGGNIIKGHWFPRVKIPPKIIYRKAFGDTAQKIKEHNDYSVFQVWGLGDDGKIYRLDSIRGKWEAPDLKRQCVDFWNKNVAIKNMGALRKLIIEDKSSGTGLIQDIKRENHIPVEGIERVKDKLTRLMDVVSYIEAGYVCVLEDDSTVSDFIRECEEFTADDTHSHDDQIDPMIDAINEMCAKRDESFYTMKI